MWRSGWGSLGHEGGVLFAVHSYGVVGLVLLVLMLTSVFSYYCIFTTVLYKKGLGEDCKKETPYKPPKKKILGSIKYKNREERGGLGL